MIILSIMLVGCSVSITEKDTACKTKVDSLTKVADSLYLNSRIERSSITVPQPNPPVVEEEEVEREVPSFTTFKIGDRVCILDLNESGTVYYIYWSERNPELLVYTVQHYNEDTEEYSEEDYYESELKGGGC